MLFCRVLLLSVPCVGQIAWLYLRAWPDPVFEGDTLTLQCHGRRNMALSQVNFYKDGKLLQSPETRRSLSMGTATLESSGRYSCSGKVAYVPHLGRQTSKMVMIQVQELFPPPTLRAVPSPKLREGTPLTLRCQPKLHPQRSASRLLFSFHRDDSTLQDWGPLPELSLPRAQEGDSGLYWCRATLEGGVAQKQSPQLEVRVQAPVSQPLLTLRPGPTGLAVGAMVELLCEAQKGSPPILYSFYLDGKVLGNISSPYGRATSFPVTVMSEQDARYSCRAENYVSGETSEPKILCLDALMVTPTRGSSAPISPHWLVPGLSVSLLGMLVITTALLAYCRLWRTPEPPPSQNPPPAPGEEQDTLYSKLHWQNENEDDDYPAVYTTSRKSRAGPAASASGTQDISVIYTEVKRSQLGERPAAKRNPRSRTHKVVPGHFEEVLHY